MRQMTVTAAFAAAGALLAGLAGAEVSAVSADATLDTRSICSVAVVDDQELDTRSFTEDRSAARQLNTKRILGTLMLMR